MIADTGAKDGAHCANCGGSVSRDTLEKMVHATRRETSLSDRMALSRRDRTAASDDNGRWIALPEVLKRVGIGKSMLYKLIDAGRFPGPIKLSAKCSRWPLHEVLAWRAARAAERGALL